MAIDIYRAMTYELAKKYRINIDLITPDIKNIDINTLGHGKVRKLTQN